ncbi:MAG TPA: 3-deoxy-D-manno-octulosonate 8-phosphate phosphatase [Bacteroidales bacterium]|nr:3-deoxy-D-manno-octulosonate 8-phosphate phosphatase [Bacteroidales bacterium]HCB61698.1 3-deoxy-D-manno-octulosonate 8-phosphate phosphatase [Bacteroidales bacterium]HCY22074.1 3-deoxy-D-manno-octulosonate 8-phosphate phosphatase [Bacteroidales bacterium]
MKTFISNLKKIMESEGLSAEELSIKCGLERTSIQAFLNEQSYPKPSELAQMAKAMKLPFESFILPVFNIPKTFDCRLLALDVDGVMTDGGMFVTSDQKEMKKFNTRDGMAMKIAARLGIEVGFISNGLMEELIGYRAEMIHVNRYYVGNDKKLPVLEGWCKELGIELSQVAYIGDDINDLDVIRKVGLSACPADATPAVKAEVDFVLRTKGGKGCVREFGEMLGWTR